MPLNVPTCPRTTGVWSPAPAAADPSPPVAAGPAAPPPPPEDAAPPPVVALTATGASTRERLRHLRLLIMLMFPFRELTVAQTDCRAGSGTDCARAHLSPTGLRRSYGRRRAVVSVADAPRGPATDRTATAIAD